MSLLGVGGKGSVWRVFAGGDVLSPAACSNYRPLRTAGCQQLERIAFESVAECVLAIVTTSGRAKCEVSTTSVLAM